jgi:RNA polymerase sigma-70 factor (ECF subfamily)
MKRGGTLKSENLIQRLNRALYVGIKAPPFANLESFNDLYETTYLSVFRYVYGLTGGPQAEVEDLTAETYLRAWKNRHAYGGDPHYGIGWVMKIARNLVIDLFRREKAGIPISDDPVEDEILSLSREGHPEEAMVAGEQQQLIVNLLAKLPPEQREMLVLRYLLDWKVQQIGQYLEIPENTVSVSIHRALEKLRAYWPAEKE